MPGRATVFIRGVRTRGDLVSRFRRDPLLADTAVYFICLHEIGHALGLSHTRTTGDVMSEGSREPALTIFSRHRRTLTSRASIREVAWLSANDLAMIHTRYAQ